MPKAVILPHGSRQLGALGMVSHAKPAIPVTWWK
jgi:hypothetical protein